MPTMPLNRFAPPWAKSAHRMGRSDDALRLRHSAPRNPPPPTHALRSVRLPCVLRSATPLRFQDAAAATTEPTTARDSSLRKKDFAPPQIPFARRLARTLSQMRRAMALLRSPTDPTTTAHLSNGESQPGADPGK